jgi:hypothetical protein
MLVHHDRMALTANSPVSATSPTLTQPSFVRLVIDAVGDGPAQLGIDEVVHVDPLGSPSGCHLTPPSS